MIDRITIGLDLGRTTRHQVAVKAAGAETARLAGKVRSAAPALDAMLDRAGAGDGDCDVVVEPTGMAWFPVAAYLGFRGCRVIRVDTRRAAQFRRFMSQTTKSDAVDARALAQLPGVLPEVRRQYELPDAKLFAMDRACRQRRQFTQEVQRAKQRTTCCVEAYWPNLKASLRGSILSVGGRTLLRHYFDPARAVEAGEDGLRQCLIQHGARGRETLPARFLAEAQRTSDLWQPMRAVGRCPVDFKAAQAEIRAIAKCCGSG